MLLKDVEVILLALPQPILSSQSTGGKDSVDLCLHFKEALSIGWPLPPHVKIKHQSHCPRLLAKTPSYGFEPYFL